MCAFFKPSAKVTELVTELVSAMSPNAAREVSNQVMHQGRYSEMEFGFEALDS